MTFPVSNQRLPGINWDAPPAPRDLDFLDTSQAAEQRNRTALLQGFYRSTGSQYGVVDAQNPNSASAGSGRSLVVQPSGGNPLYCDVLPGVAVTRAGNVIEIPEQVIGIPLAVSGLTRDVLCVVLLEYLTIPDPDTNVVTDYGTVEAVRRRVGPTFDINQIDVANPSNLDSTHNASTNAIKIVTLSTFQDLSKFSLVRLNDCVVLAVVKVVTDPVTPANSILSVDMTNTVALNVTDTVVRPWWSPVDQQHRAALGSGTVTSTNIHGLGFNDLSSGLRTLYQQAFQHGVVVSPDLDVPGCPGRLCTEFCDDTRVLTDTTGAITGTINRKYVKLNGYPKRLLGVRANSAPQTPDTSVDANSLTAELRQNSNILLLGRGFATNEAYHSVNGFTVYYTDSDAVRPPALPGELPLLANNVVQFGDPVARELVVTAGRAYNTLPTKTLSMTNAGPFQKQYRVWLGGDEQFVAGPQVVNCAKLIEGTSGVGTTVQTPQFSMWGPARVRVGLWNVSALPTMQATVEIVGTDVAGVAQTETVVIAANSLLASPVQVAWSQTTTDPDIALDPDAFQVTSNVFASITSWRITSKADIGASGLIQVWADIEPTTTPALDDALPVARLWWNGQSVKNIEDLRTVVRGGLMDPDPGSNGMWAATLALAAGGQWTDFAYEDFKNPRWQDVVLSRRDRHSDGLRSRADTEAPYFAADGSCPNAREWYYSRAFLLPDTQNSLLVAFTSDDKSGLLRESFSGDVLLEYQVAHSTTPSTWSTWVYAPPVNGNRNLRTINLTASPIGGVASPYFKVRFRVLAKGARGYTVVLRSA